MLLDEPPGLQVMVSVDAPCADELDAGWPERAARVALAAAGVSGVAEVSLLITGDDTVRALNAEYRGLDETTDVLSFSADHPGQWEGEGDGPAPDVGGFVLPPGMPRPLGEIIVSWPQAQRQAAGRGIAPMRELAHLVIHGALHLVGYDHAEPDETAVMQGLEGAALESLGLTDWREGKEWSV